MTIWAASSRAIPSGRMHEAAEAVEANWCGAGCGVLGEAQESGAFRVRQVAEDEVVVRVEVEAAVGDRVGHREAVRQPSGERAVHRGEPEGAGEMLRAYQLDHLVVVPPAPGVTVTLIPEPADASRPGSVIGSSC